MKIVTLTCMSDECGERAHYAVQQLRVLLYTHGVCAVQFSCAQCGQQSEMPLPAHVALQLDRSGAQCDIIRVPDEICEWPDKAVPAITESDAGIMERSTHAHFEDCVRRELLGGLDLSGDNARSEG